MQNAGRNQYYQPTNMNVNQQPPSYSATQIVSSQSNHEIPRNSPTDMRPVEQCYPEKDEHMTQQSYEQALNINTQIRGSPNSQITSEQFNYKLVNNLTIKTGNLVILKGKLY